MNGKFAEMKESFSRFLPYFKLLKPVKKQFSIGVVMGVLAGLTSGFGVPAMLYFIIPILSKEPRPSLWIMIGCISFLPLVVLIRAVTGFINTYMISFCGMRVLLQMQSKMLRRLQELPLGFYHKNTIGDLMARVMGDTAALQMVVTKVANDLIKEPVTLISAVFALIFLAIKERDAWFIMMFAATVPVIILPLQIFGKRILKRARQVQEHSGDISKYVSENLNAAREIRAFNLQEKEMSRFEHAFDEFCHLSMKVVKYGSIIRPTIEVIGVACVSVSLLYILDKGVLHIAAAMLGALYMAYEPIKKFGEIHMSLKKGEAAIQRIEYVLDAENDVPEPETPTTLKVSRGQVDFEDVYFRYLDEWVLNKINLSFAPGSVVAFVGPSGAGKTTLADLIPRFYDAEKGCVKVDGIDVKTVLKKDLRAGISVVSQDTFLFNESILENIRIGKSDATDDEVFKAAQHAFAHDFILEMTDGYATVVGERGTRLSGGQKQRIAIARAFLKRAPILILDEATSALDSESEQKIQTALEELVRGKTVFMIAHRFATIRMADTIVVMEDGYVRGVGNHAELYESNELYTMLYNRQFID